jgi:hypothetical protein
MDVMLRLLSLLIGGSNHGGKFYHPTPPHPSGADVMINKIFSITLVFRKIAYFWPP